MLLTTRDMIPSQYPHLTHLGVFSTMLRRPKKALTRAPFSKPPYER